MVCRLHKALYSLKKAPRAWYERLHNYLVKIGFERTDDNNNLYLKIGGKGIFDAGASCFYSVTTLEFMGGGSKSLGLGFRVWKFGPCCKSRN